MELIELHHISFQKRKIRLFMKREDLIHPIISGNKWRKLKYNILKAQEEKQDTLLTFGGSHSNHIAAVAGAGQKYGFKTIGIIRGERIEPLNPTLTYASEQGMQLHFVSRAIYREKKSKAFLQSLVERYEKFYLIPEGGSNRLAVKGCAEIIADLYTNIDFPIQYICSSVGTGGTLAGLITGCKKGEKILGFSALKGGFLKEEVGQLLENNISYNDWELIEDYHFGGYAKFTTTLIDFINNFKKQFNIPLDPIYTGKLCYGIFDLIEKEYFKNGANIIAIHTGGLQGIKGFNKRFSNIIDV